ncbi:MAG TPA: RNA-binding protein [Flavisolibacter sp.]|nr:RNA-binding protein [Flavisolibacter sp.]
MNIYVYNLPVHLNDKELESLFSFYGEVMSAKIEKDELTGQSKSIAYVHMPIDAQAQLAIADLDGLELYGKKIIVEEEGFTKTIQLLT